ncbi:MAG: hypothetical protein WCB18_01750 [Thermoplasmata archaeon]
MPDEDNIELRARAAGDAHYTGFLFDATMWLVAGDVSVGFCEVFVTSLSQLLGDSVRLVSVRCADGGDHDGEMSSN